MCAQKLAQQLQRSTFFLCMFAAALSLYVCCSISLISPLHSPYVISRSTPKNLKLKCSSDPGKSPYVQLLLYFCIRFISLNEAQDLHDSSFIQKASHVKGTCQKSSRHIWQSKPSQTHRMKQFGLGGKEISVGIFHHNGKAILDELTCW